MKVKIGACPRSPEEAISTIDGNLSLPSDPMAPSLEPCPCPKCNGALVSHKTVLRHAAANHTHQPIPTFDEWIAAAPEQLDRVSDGSSEDSYDGMDGIEDEKVIREPLNVC